MAAEISAVSKISVDRGPEASARLLPSRRLRRTTRRVEIQGIVDLRKVVEAVIKVAAEAVAIVALRHPAVVDSMQAVVIAVVADPAAATAVADPTAVVMAGSRAYL